jgi:hypothetical protein
MSTLPPPNWNVNARVQAVLEEHEHPVMTEARLAAMKAAAKAEFDAALRDRGTDPSRFELIVHIDELIGPMAFVKEVDPEKRDWPLPMFNAWLKRS